MNKLSLQWHITILTALVLTISTTALTLLAMFNAESSFMVLLDPSTDTDALNIPIEANIIMDPLQMAKSRFNLYSILSCVIITFLGAIAAYFITGKALKPLSDLSKAVAAIDETTLTERLPKATGNNEVGLLTDRFNAMLSRLDDAFLRQKRFTANAAHELKTPLATMKTGIQVLALDKEATLEDYREHTKKTLNDIDRLSATVDDLLLLAMADSGIRHEKDSIWFEPLFEAIVSDLESLLTERAIQCHIDCDDATIIANTAFIYRAFSNLVENACKYGHSGGNIWLTARENPTNVTITVQDDGPGIADEHLPYIFDAFYRVDKSRSRAMGGAGLGLSLVKTIIEADNGSINVTSSDKGTCFTVTFPRAY